MYKRAFASLTTMIESCIGLRGTTDARRMDIDNYRKKELCTKAKRLFVLVSCAVFASLIFMLLAPFFALAWAVRLSVVVVAVIYAYNLKSDIYEEAEKII